MKRMFLLGLLLVALSLTGCALTKDFTLTLERTFNVNYNGTSYALQNDVDATEASSDFDKYVSDLKSVKIEEVTYLVSNFTGPATQKIVSAKLQVGPTDGSTPTDIATMADVVLSSVAAKEQTLNTSNAGEEELEDLLLKGDHQARIYFTGTANQAPVKFTIKFTIECKVKYEKKLI